jgi:hypothetical protein
VNYTEVEGGIEGSRVKGVKLKFSEGVIIMKDECNVETVEPRAAPSLMRRVSWGAIFAGLMTTIVLQLMLTLLGVAIGASTIDPLKEQNPAEGLGIGSAIWLVLSGAISLFAGAWVAGRLSGGPRYVDGMLHGLVTWSAATVTMVLLAATAAGALIGGAGALVRSISSRAGSQQQGGSQMAGVEEHIKQMFPQAGELLSPTGREGEQTPGALTDIAKKDPQIAAALARLASRGGASASPSDRDEIVHGLTTRHGMDQQQATTLVTQWDQNFQRVKGQAEQKSREAGDKAAKTTSKGALWGFIGLAIGGLVAAWGGWIGTASLARRTEPRPTGRATTHA